MRLLLPILLWLLLGGARAEILLKDDRGITVRLAAPAQRIVSLAPHITELVYAAGAGEREQPRQLVVGAAVAVDDDLAIERVGDDHRRVRRDVTSGTPSVIIHMTTALPSGATATWGSLALTVSSVSTSAAGCQPVAGTCRRAYTSPRSAVWCSQATWTTPAASTPSAGLGA